MKYFFDKEHDYEQLSRKFHAVERGTLARVVDRSFLFMLPAVRAEISSEIFCYCVVLKQIKHFLKIGLKIRLSDI